MQHCCWCHVLLLPVLPLFSHFLSLCIWYCLSLSMLVMAFVLILCHYESAIYFDFQTCSTRTKVHHHHLLLDGNGTASSSSESLQLLFLITSNILLSFYPVTFFFHCINCLFWILGNMKKWNFILISFALKLSLIDEIGNMNFCSLCCPCLINK